MPAQSKQYKIDGTVVNKNVVQSLILQSQNIKFTTTISQVFNLCNNLVEYEQDPSDRSVKISIKNIMQQRFNNKQSQTNQQQVINQYKVNLSQIYLLNKPGNFGRVLQRKCRLVQKGVMQYQQGKQAKLKEVKSFLNKIQHVQNKQLTDLAWLNTQPEKYKFRIILYDLNQNNKGIYFQTFQQAQCVRAYLVHKYKKTTINNQVFNSLKYNLVEDTVNAFVDKIKYKNLITKINLSQKPKLNKQHQNSSNNSEIKFSSGNQPKLIFNSKTNENQQEINKNYTNNTEFTKTIKIQQPPAGKKNFMTGFLDDLINQHNKNDNLKQSNIKSQKTISKSKITNKNKNIVFQKFNQACINDFFLKWKDIAIKKRSKFPGSKIISQKQDQQIEMQKSRANSKISKKVQNSRGQQVNTKPLSSAASPFNQFDDYQQSQDNNPFLQPITINQNVSSVESSPIKQSSRINKVLAHSRKQQSIFKIPQRIQQEESMSQNQLYTKTKKIGTQKIVFKSVQFMDHSLLSGSNTGNKNQQNADLQSKNKNINKQVNNVNLLFKPIINISIHKHKKKQQPSNKQKTKNPRNRIQQQHLQGTSTNKQSESKKGEFIFNTMIKKSYRTMEYQLVPTEGQGEFQTQQSMNTMYMMLSVTNFLTNEEIMECMFELNQFGFVRYRNTIVDKESRVKMKFQYQSTGVAEPQAVYKNNQNSQSSLFFSIPKIDPEIIKKIKTYWQTEAISNSYYNLEDNFSIFDAVSNSSNQAEPLNWWLDLDQKEYNYLCILKSSSIILGYKLCQPMLYIIKAVKNIHFKIQKIIEMLLSIILNLGNYYYFPQNLSKVNYLHRQVGLSKGNMDFQNRIFLEVLLFQKFLAFQCPQLNQKLQRKNIAISHLMLQYTYELFSRNFGIQVLCQYWSYCVEEIQKVPLIFFLTTISLCRLLSDKLLRCNRLLDIREIFESKKIRSSILLLNEIKQLRLKYFSKGEGFIQQIKQAFQQKPFENVLNIYYKRLSDNQAKMKRQNVKYKHSLCNKVLQHVQTQQALQLFTKYAREPKKYTLHVYFYQLPQIQGKFVICTGQSQYESLNVNKNRYFIIGEVTSKVTIKYIDYKGNDFHGQLVLNQGFNEFKIKLLSEKTQQEHEIHYLCGLLTDTQIEMIKANKKFSHFMGPNITIQFFKDQLLRPFKQARHTESWMDEEWFRDLRVIFSHGNKLFSEVSYFMNLLISESITHQQKLAKIRQFSVQISQQYFLCDNNIVYKQLLYEFYKMTFIPLKQQDFQCYFNDSLELEFQAPKILKCRFVTQTKQIKLEKQINQYWSKKCFTHLYGDMFIDEILSVCQKYIKSKTSALTDGQLKILYSTFGNIELKVIPLKLQNKKFLIDYEKQTISESVFHQIAQKEPQLLMTEVLPSFTKISTILDYVNSSKNIDLKSRGKETLQKKVIPENINLLKYAQTRMKNCLLLRYGSFPTNVKVPFYSYYSELTMNPEIPKFQHYYFKNIKDSIKSICLSKQQLRFSSNNKQQDQDFDKSVGLYGNLRKLRKIGSHINTVFFWIENKEDHSIPKSLVWQNYGYGIGRWQHCIIKQYRKMIKRRNKNNVRTPKNQNQLKKQQESNKIEYFVQKGRKKFYARDYQVKLNPEAKEHLSENKAELQKQFLETNNDIKNGLGFLLAPSNLNQFVKSLKR